MPIQQPTRSPHNGEQTGEEGFLLVGAIVLIALVLLVLSIAAPRVAQELRREREVEAEHRGNEYVRAIRMYYQKIGSYPTSITQLENTNNMRFLRRRYLDPMTGKDDWRLIMVGQNKTSVKTFFGQPLGGLPGAGGGLGSASGMASGGQAGAGAAGTTGATGGATDSGPGGSGPTSSGPASSGPTSSGPGSGSSFGSSSGSSFGSGFGSSSSGSAFGSGGSTGPFMGVGVPKDATSIVTLNEQTNYSKWEFLYDPRIEQLYAKASLFGGGMTSTDASSLGSASGMNSGLGGSTNPNGAPGSPAGSPGSPTNTSGSSPAGGTTGTTSPTTTPPPQ